MNDYTDLVVDMGAAYGASLFNWDGGMFHRRATHNAGSFGWPWEFQHVWSVVASAPTRDALIRQGWVEVLPDTGRMETGGYRLSLKALSLLSENRGLLTLGKTPSMIAFHAAMQKAQDEKTAAPHQSRTL